MRPLRSRPLLRTLRLALGAATALVLAGCGSEPALRLADYAHFQRDQVTTRSVPAHSELAQRLADEGWRLETPEDAEARLRLNGDRARIWFYAADGGSTGIELHGRIEDPQGAAGHSLSYRVNDRQRSVATWRADAPSLALGFPAGAARRGWNALDLFLHGTAEEVERIVMELRGFRVLDAGSEGGGDDGPRTLEVEDDDLLMPGESDLFMAFEATADARLRGVVRSEADRAGAEPHRVAIRLLDRDGAPRELAALTLAAGAREQLDLDLASWAGQAVELRVAVRGPRSSSVRWSDAGIVGDVQRNVEAPILPAPTPASGRLGRPDVVLIVLDAARADAFGAYGAQHPTPTVDALALAGTRFVRAQSPSAWTGQSIPALLSGFHPDTLHTTRWGDPLPEEVPHLAQLMAAAGYRTVLWSQHPIYNRAESLVRGFELVRYSGRRKRMRFPPRSFLVERGRPTFALIHLLPPHSPYAPPRPFRGAYTSDYRGKLSPKLGALARIGKKRALSLAAEDRAYIFNRYLENVAFADWLVGRVLHNLQRSRRFENALVVITSDHGEAFAEHGLFMHSRELYQEFIRIPMVVKWPAGVTGFAPAIDEPVTLIDLVPTLVDGLGLGGGERGFQGRSLLPAVFDGVRLERPVYATTRGLGDVGRIPKPRWMLEEGSWRVIHDPVRGRTELYAASDERDASDLAARHPAVARLLLQQLLLQKWLNLSLLRLGPRAEIELDPELVEELKALGYL